MRMGVLFLSRIKLFSTMPRDVTYRTSSSGSAVTAMMSKVFFRSVITRRIDGEMEISRA